MVSWLRRVNTYKCHSMVHVRPIPYEMRSGVGPTFAYCGRGLHVHQTKLCIHKLCKWQRLVLRWFLIQKGYGLRTVLLGLVSCPGYFLHTEGKNSLVNSLFRFCSKRHVSGTPIRLLHENDVTYCNKWRPKTAWRLKRYTRDRIRERTSEGIAGLPWTCSMCFWACQLAEWSS